MAIVNPLKVYYIKSFSAEDMRAKLEGWLAENECKIININYVHTNSHLYCFIIYQPL